MRGRQCCSGAGRLPLRQGRVRKRLNRGRGVSYERSWCWDSEFECFANSQINYRTTLSLRSGVRTYMYIYVFGLCMYNGRKTMTQLLRHSLTGVKSMTCVLSLFLVLLLFFQLNSHQWSTSRPVKCCMQGCHVLQVLCISSEIFVCTQFMFCMHV